MFALSFFLLDATATTGTYTLSLHDALPISFVERRHEFLADARDQRHGPGDHQHGHAQRQRPMAQRPAKHRAVDRDQRAHDGIRLFAADLAPDQETAEHGNERDRENRGTHHRERLGEGQRVEELALLAREREHRDEGQDDDDHREEDRPPDEAGGLEHGLGHPATVPGIDAALLDKAVGVLRDHDGRVDEHADRDGDPRQRHDVGADAQVTHEEEGDQHGERERDRHDQDRAHVEQEDDVDERDDDRLLDEGPPERVDRPLDERGAVVERDDLHPRREPGCQLRDPLLDPVDHVDRADAVTGDDDAPDGFVPALEQGADAEGVADLHVRHLTDEDWHTPLGAHHDLLDVLDALDQPEAADHRPGAARLDNVAADVAI